MNFIFDKIRNKNYIIIYISVILLGYFLFNKFELQLNNIIIIGIICFILYFYNKDINIKSDIEKKQKKNIGDRLNIKYIDDYEELYNLTNDLYHRYYKYNKYAFNKALVFMENFVIGLKNYENTKKNIENLQFARQNFLNNLSNIVIKIPLDKEDYFNRKVEFINKTTLKYLIKFSDYNSDYVSDLNYFRDNPHFIY